LVEVAASVSPIRGTTGNEKLKVLDWDDGYFDFYGEGEDA